MRNVNRFFRKKLHQREIKKSIGLMKRLDNRVIPTDLDEIRLFMIVRNEKLRIPFMMSKYREFGVDRFFIVDNNSTDATIDKIFGQDDVHVFQTTESFQKKGICICSVEELNNLLKFYLTHEQERKDKVKILQTQILSEFTYEKRAQQLKKIIYTLRDTKEAE